MNKKSILMLVLSVIVSIAGIYLMKFQDERFDFLSGILVGIGMGSFASVIATMAKSNFDKTYKKDWKPFDKNNFK